MTTKAEFNAEEWQKIVEAPALAGLIVISAQRGGTIRESVKMAGAYTEAKKAHDSDLLGEIVATVPRVEPRQFKDADSLRAQGADMIREAVALVESKATPEELEAYRAFAIDVAKRAAEATKSGDVLGIGGERVSDKEREALGAVAEALGTSPPE